MNSDIGIVIPFYYLSDNFEDDIKRLQFTIDSIIPYTTKIVVVDDGTKLISINNAKLIKHSLNIGKGGAIRTGIEYLLSDPTIKFIIEIDADNDQDPKETKKFIDYFKTKNYLDNYLVIGDRYSAPEMKNIVNYRKSINKIQTILFSYFGYTIRDSVSGFRGYSRNFADIILKNSKSKGFGIATEELILAYLSNAILTEIPLDYAKPRKSFTKAYKLAEVIDGITLHSSELEQKGLKELTESLDNVKSQIKQGINPIKFKLNKNEFEFRHTDEAYTID